jgi:hypothetical protein
MPEFGFNGAIAKGHGLHWYDKTRTIFQDCSSGKCNISLSDGTRIKDFNLTVPMINEVSACGCSYWAAWVLLESNAQPGVLDADGREFPGAGLGPMGPDQSYALKSIRDSFGPWFVVERKNSWKLTDFDATDIQLLGNKRAIFRVNAALQTFPETLEINNRPVGSDWGWPRVIFINGKAKLLYQSFVLGCLVFDGKVLLKGTIFFRPDVIAYDNGILVCWGLDEGESQTEVEHWTFAELDALPFIDNRIIVPNPHPNPPPIVEPPKMDTLDLPNHVELVRSVIRAHTEINILDEAERGKIVDIVAKTLNNGSVAPYGRKARNADGSNKNTDGLTFLNSDGRFTITDIIFGADPNPNNPDRGKFASWDTDGRLFKPGENGFWARFESFLDNTPNPDPDKPNPDPKDTNPSTPLDLTELLNRLDSNNQKVIEAINQASADEIKKLDEVKVAFIKGIKEASVALVNGGGLTDILGKIIKK